MNVEFYLKEHQEPLACEDDLPLELKGKSYLWHQVETFKSLQEYQLVLNCSDTGTGKTKAAHMWLLGQKNLKRVVIIAPTNALVAQHEEDMQSFLEEHGLSSCYEVVAFDAKRAYSYKEKIRVKKGEDYAQRIYRYGNGRALLEIWKDPSIISEKGENQNLILITNPDIFRLATHFDYGSHMRDLAVQFITETDYLIVDETHSYTATQLVSLFFSLLLWSSGLAKSSTRKILMLTATPEADLDWFLGVLSQLEVCYHKILPIEAPSSLKKVVSLAPLRLRFLNDQLDFSQGWYQDDFSLMKDLFEEKKDILVLSDSLNRINKLSYILKENYSIESKRITGMIQHEERKKAALHSFVLATPTVDLGFNFPPKKGKKHQAIDVVFCEAPTLDKLWQRLGRAGRVLSCQEKNKESFAVAHIPTRFYDQLKIAFENKEVPQEMDRVEFKKYFQNLTSGEMNKRGLVDFSMEHIYYTLAWAFAGFEEACSQGKREDLKKIVEKISKVVLNKNICSDEILKFGKGLKEVKKLWPFYQVQKSGFPREGFSFEHREWFVGDLASLEKRKYLSLNWLFKDEDGRYEIIKKIKNEDLFDWEVIRKRNLYFKVLENLLTQVAKIRNYIGFRGSDSLDETIFSYDTYGLILDESSFSESIDILRIINNFKYQYFSKNEIPEDYKKKEGFLKGKDLIVINELREDVSSVKVFIKPQKSDLEKFNDPDFFKKRKNFRKILCSFSIELEDKEMNIVDDMRDYLKNQVSKKGIIYIPVLDAFLPFVVKREFLRLGIFPSAKIFIEGKSEEYKAYTDSRAMFVLEIYRSFYRGDL